MFVERIKLKNYRNYQSFDISLGSKATVLIGKNGAGKTNLISALKQSLSFIFSKSQDSRQFTFLSSLDQRVRSFESTDPYFGPVSDAQSDYHYPVAIHTDMRVPSVNGELVDLNWDIEKLDATKGAKESYAKVSNAFWDVVLDKKKFPVLAFYSDSFPHVATKIGPKVQAQLDSGNVMPQNFGYYKWDDVRDCTVIWSQYFVMRWKNNMYNPSEADSKYIDSVKKCLMDFSLPLENSVGNEDFALDEVSVQARGKDDIFVLKFKNGKTLPFDSLPAGYARVFSMVFDLANRSYALNENCDPEGIVFIDEVDLHLHPSLAQEILDRLIRSFGNVQFIVSTHSPLVVSNFKSEEGKALYQLSKDDSGSTVRTRLDYSYGIDYDSLLKDLMETPIRNSLLGKFIEKYHYWKSAEDEELMLKYRNEIVKLVGEKSSVVSGLDK